MLLHNIANSHGEALRIARAAVDSGRADRYRAGLGNNVDIFFDGRWVRLWDDTTAAIIDVIRTTLGADGCL